MKQFLFIISFLFSFVGANAQAETSKQEFKSPSLKELVQNAKTIAILPFKATVTYKRMPKGASVESLQEEEKKLSSSLQEGMLTYLLRKSNNYTVKFQDVDRTNALLKKAGIYGDIDAVLPDSVCKVLGVDGIIKSTWTYEKDIEDIPLKKHALRKAMGSRISRARASRRRRLTLEPSLAHHRYPSRLHCRE